LPHLNSKTPQNPSTLPTQKYFILFGDLELGLGLGLLEDGVQLGGLHDIALDLELAGHEETLGVGLAGDESAEVRVGEVQGDCRQDSISKCDTKKKGGGRIPAVVCLVVVEHNEKHTSGLLAETLANGAALLQVDVPAVGLASSVLKVESKDGVALLDGILLVGLAGVKGSVDGVKGGRGGELGYIGSARG